MEGHGRSVRFQSGAPDLLLAFARRFGMITPMRLLCLIAGFCLAALPAVARWYGPADNKERAALEKLDAKGLFAEAFEVCVRRAQLLRQTPNREQAELLSAAEQYLSVIEDVVRHHSGGRVPQWLRSLSFAHTTQDCQAVFRSFLGGETAPETQPAAGAEAKPPAPPTHGAGRGLPAQRAVRPARTPTNTPVIRVPAFPILWFSPTPERRQPPRPPSPSPRPTRTPTAARRVAPPTVPPRTAPAQRPQRDEVTDELPPWFY